MLDNNVNKNQQNMTFSAMSQAQLQSAGQPVSMQAVNPELLRENVQDSYVSNRLKASEGTNPFAMLGVGAGVWYGLGQLMDRFNPKCAGDYKDTVFGKLGGWGDKFSQKTFVGKKMEQFFNWIKSSTDKLSQKSRTVYSLKNHSTRPEWSFAKIPGSGLHGFLASDTEQVFEEFLKPLGAHEGEKAAIIPISKKYNAFQKLEQYGVSQDRINQLRNQLKGKSFAEQAIELEKEELRCLGFKDEAKLAKLQKVKGLGGLQKLARNLKVRMLGFNSLSEYDALKGKFVDHPEKVMAALEKASKNNFFVSIWRGNGSVRNHLFGRKVSPSEYLNKYKATLGKGGEASVLGRFLPKALGWFMEGTTNRFAGGKLAVAMQAGIFADMLIHTFKAPKGEKGKTFAERFVNDFTYFFAMTAGIMGMHKIGGFKYIGLDKQGVEKYRKALEAFNKDVEDGKLNTKQAYKKAAKAVDDLLKPANGKKLNIFQKTLQKIGKLINWGNERKFSYRSTKGMNLNLLRKCANGNILGVPLRIIIPMMVVSPFIAKWVTKGAHAIFGKPTRSVLDEDKEGEEQQPENSQQTNLPPQLQQNPQNNQPQPAQPPQSVMQPQNLAGNTYPSPTNLLYKYKNPQQNPLNNEKNEDIEPKRTYIPSPIGVQLNNTEDLSPAQAALKRADFAEQQAYQTLKMN